MDFYTTLSAHYDHIFGIKKQAVSFIKKQLPVDKGSTLVDVAAGTGAEAIQLAKDGYTLVACDLNEDMVDIMRDKVSSAELPIEVYHLDMRNISQLPKENYDGIYCIGNSFVHLDSYDEMEKVLQNFYSKLTPGGKVIIQIVNFDRMKEEGMTFPVIERENPHLIFKRFYTEAGEKITFHMTLQVEVETEERILSSETELTPLYKEDFSKLLSQSPFDSFKLYGNFKGSDYSIESEALIAVLEK